MIALLIHSLPAAERGVMGAILSSSGVDEHLGQGNPQAAEQSQLLAQAELEQLASPILDSFPLTPLFYVHLAASQRSITRDMDEQARRWKDRKNIPERRVRVDRFEDYLRVWDLREGWAGGDYCLSEERHFRRIAADLGLSPSTVFSQYRAAFQLITGHEFTPQLWWRLFGPLKFSAFFGNPARQMSRAVRRRLHSPSPRDVPDSVVTPRGTDTISSGIVELESSVISSRAENELLMDLIDLMDRGMSNERIAEWLGHGSPQDIEEIRRRRADFGELMPLS